MDRPQFERRITREVLARLRSELTVRGIALVAVGVLIGIGVSQSFGYFREQARLKSFRQKAEALFNKLAPKAEMQLSFLNDHLDEIRSQVAQGITSTNSVSVAVSGYETQQRRVRLQLEQVDRILSQLTAFADQASRDFKIRPAPEILPADLQQKLVELQTRQENTQKGLQLLATEVSFAKERQFQMALAEAGAAKRAEAEALRNAQVEIESAQHTQTEAVQRARTESAQRAQAEAAQRAQTEAAQRTQTEALQQILEVALLRTETASPTCQPIYVQPAVSCANDFLVIGRRYSPAYRGYGYNRFYASDYGPCYGSYGSRWFY